MQVPTGVETTIQSVKCRYGSPLRYPGGKGAFYHLLAQIILKNELRSPVYVEPFAGGAGAAIRLLLSGNVDRIVLNDADRRIFSFWQAVLEDGEEFMERVMRVPLSIAQWKFQRSINRNPESHSSFDVGFSTFYLNRCNRSGVIGNAGPIGGYAQAARYSLGARFNREALCQRIAAIQQRADSIQIRNLDALEFMKREIPLGRERRSTLVYLDPPYFHQGRRLYMNYYEDRDHRSLARYLERQRQLPWIASYDDCSEIRDAYSRNRFRKVSTWYSLNSRSQEQELLIYPAHVSVPRSLE